MSGNNGCHNEYLDEVFLPGGLFSRNKPGYVLREAQLKLARACSDAFSERKPLLAEAPTGTGKSFAYLVPATWEAAFHDRKVIVVTANIALQEQLIRNDLPFLAEHLPWKFTFALAKGWSNYACLDAAEGSRNELLKGRSLPTLQENQQLKQALDWLDDTATGDVSELPFELTHELRQRLTITKDDCLGKACDHFVQCHPRRARAQLDQVQVLVANYHLFFADLALKNMGLAGILPAYSLVVLDEGHKAADIARDFFGQRVTPGSVSRAVSLLDAKGRRAEKLSIPERLDPELRAQVVELADRLFVDLARLKADEKRYKARLDRRGLFDPSELCRALRSAATELSRGMARGGVSPDGRKHLEQASSRCLVLASTLERAAQNADEEDWVYFLDDISNRKGAVALMAVPFSVREVLRPILFENEKDPVGVVVTSATLTTSSGESGFDFLVSQLGAETATELIVDSPFDFSKSCFVVPRICSPSNAKGSAWLDEMAEAFVESVKLAGGRTLGLFTSYKALQVAYQRMHDDLPFGIRVMKQGDAPRTQLLQKFRDDESSVLLGCESFWEGVDVPGPSLSLVFIDRIPFDHALDPILDAVQARDSKAFTRYQLPRATIMFRQGFGRLVRSVSDHGVVVCCDSRIVDKGYGKGFLRALPKGVQVLRRLEQAKAFLP